MSSLNHYEVFNYTEKQGMTKIIILKQASNVHKLLKKTLVTHKNNQLKTKISGSAINKSNNN